MFKKSLIAVAVLGATAFSVQAAEVTMYGKVDLGLQYQNYQVDEGSQAKIDEDKFSMENGRNSASRFGVKGSEDLGNGMKVSFQLENGFKADSGEFKTSGKLFDRQATVALSSDFGTLTMGRVGGIGSGAGFDIVYLTGDSFDGGCGDVLGLVQSDRYDNMITYQTPKFAGLQATVQYSFNEDSVEETAREGSSAVNRYSSAALTGDFGALQTVLAYEFQNYKSFGAAAEHDDGQIVYLGGNYDCGFAKTFVMGQYFKGIKAGQLTAITEDDADRVDSASSDGVKGYGVHLGTIVPVAGGDLTVAAYFTDFAVEYADHDDDAKSYAFGAKYEYYLSKRTSVYTGAGFAQVKYDDDGSDKTTQAYLGLTHRF